MPNKDASRKPLTSDVFGELRPGESGDTWEGEIHLPAWADCNVRWEIGPDDVSEAKDLRSEREKQGIFKLVINVGRGQEPGPEHVAAYHYLRANDRQVLDRVLAELADHVRQHYFAELLEDCDDEDFEKQLKRLGSPQRINELLDPPTVTLHRQSEGGLAHVSFDCDCAWDEEHGVGVLTHEDRVVEITGCSENYDL